MRGEPGRRTLLVGAAVALSFIAFAVMTGLTITQLLGEPSVERPPATLASRPADRSYARVPEAESVQAHRDLHALGEACADEGDGAASAIEARVSALVAFARRNPDGRFDIDDESGTSLSLLLVLQDELRTCAPALLPQVQALLPEDFRRTPDPSSASSPVG